MCGVQACVDSGMAGDGYGYFEEILIGGAGVCGGGDSGEGTGASMGIGKRTKRACEGSRRAREKS